MADPGKGRILSGSCLCGAVRYEVSDEFLYAPTAAARVAGAQPVRRSSRLPESSAQSSR
jgi:hypothetical protein